MSVTDEYLRNNAVYAERFNGPLPLPPARHVAVVACMDARLNVYGILGLAEGEAHVIRNAGGVVTDDEIRSLAISQRLLGTTEIILIHHTDCGMLTFTDDQFKRAIQDETGIKPEVVDMARFLPTAREQNSAVASSGLPVRSGCRFPLVRRHRMCSGAGNPVTGLGHSLPLYSRSPSVTQTSASSGSTYPGCGAPSRRTVGSGPTPGSAHRTARRAGPGCPS
jgi:carbonic anhydrase